MQFTDANSYLTHLRRIQRLPPGFRLSTNRIRFQPTELDSLTPYPMDISLIEVGGPRPVVVGRTTRNRFVGAPVTLTRRRLPGGRASAVIINNKVSNVASPTGMEDALRITAAVADQLGVPREEVFSASTGVIGWSLPVQEMVEAVPGLVKSLGSSNPVDLARAIMTTDAYPKMRVGSFRNGTILAVAKGAGMIEPNMGTMLAFVLTDVAISRERFDRVMGHVVETTFNRISVDGDQSTSDIVLGISSGVSKDLVRTEQDLEDFQEALLQVCRPLAVDIVRNGEGVRHVIRITVSGMPDEALAVEVAKGIGNSPLVKTAVFGNDPNVGRILMATGDSLGSSSLEDAPNLPTEGLRMSIGDIVVYSDGVFRLNPETDEKLGNLFRERALPDDSTGYPAHEGVVPIELDFQAGPAEATVWSADLTYDYVKENADYRT